jgi:hypothetical protein
MAISYKGTIKSFFTNPRQVETLNEAYFPTLDTQAFNQSIIFAA